MLFAPARRPGSPNPGTEPGPQIRSPRAPRARRRCPAGARAGRPRPSAAPPGAPSFRPVPGPSPDCWQTRQAAVALCGGGTAPTGPPTLPSRGKAPLRRARQTAEATPRAPCPNWPRRRRTAAAPAGDRQAGFQRAAEPPKPAGRMTPQEQRRPRPRPWRARTPRRRLPAATAAPCKRGRETQRSLPTLLPPRRAQRPNRWSQAAPPKRGTPQPP